jgi:hypothetical protein
VSVELKLNGSLVNIKRKKLILKAHEELLSDKKSLKRSRSRSPANEKPKEERKPLKWVTMAGMIVRVISKKVHNGKLYNKKLRVTDILSAT